MYLNRNLGVNADHGQNSASGTSSAEINRLSSELNSSLSRELDEMMSSVNTQIQRAISDAISNQILPPIQTALNAGSGHLTPNRRTVLSERPEINSEETYGEKVKKNTRCEQRIDHQNDGQPHSRAFDMVTGEHESPIQVLEFLMGRMHQEIISTSLTMISILTRRSQHKTDSPRLFIQTPLAD